jgi:iron complex outermembrane receptor protein
VYGTVNNLLTITGYKGVDPEVSLGGLTPGMDWRSDRFPHNRSFILGMKVNF